MNPNVDTGLLDTAYDADPPLDMFQTDAFHDFDSFISTMGMNLPFEPDLFTTGTGHYATPAPSGRQEMLMLHRHPTAPRLHYSHQLQNVAAGTAHMEFSHPDADELTQLKPMPCPWGYSTANREELQTAVSRHLDGVKSIKVPSRLALGRYTAAYFDECCNHFPMIHAATFRPQEVCATCPELVLAIIAFGAMVKYETAAASRLWDVAKAVTLEKWQDRRFSTTIQPLQKLQCVQAAMLLTDFAICQRPSDAMQTTSSLRDVLQEYVRHSLPSTARNDHNEINWAEWTLAERHRRTLFCIYHVLNLYSITYGLPPSLLANELHAQLASSSAAWDSNAVDAWSRHRNAIGNPLSVQDALAELVSSSTAQQLYSPLSNLALINALLQRVYLTRQMQFDSIAGPLSEADIKDMQKSLSKWTSAWQQARESILDPGNPDGSNSFTSTSYLGLAYLRLVSNYDNSRSLSSNDPEKVARDLYAAPLPPRMPEIAPALLHATQALYVPVKLGIDWISRRHFLHWDLPVFLYYLEAAVFLSKWLLSVAETVETIPLTDCESNIMQALHRIVDDTDESLDPDEDALTPSTMASTSQRPHFARGLAVRVTQVWARLFRDNNSPWPTIILIGKSLNVYARLVREEFERGDDALPVPASL